jgi:hypothetical protein
MSDEERASVNNGIWLCQSCAKLIDSDQAVYPTPLVLSWKVAAEAAAQKRLENGQTPPTSDRTSYLNRLMDMSLARCIERWRTAGLSETRAENFASNASIGSLQLNFGAHQLLIVIGEIGAGKTLIAHRYLQACIRECLADVSRPFPVFVDSFSGSRTQILSTVESVIRDFGLAAHNLLIVIDGADEPEMGGFDRVLTETRMLCSMRGIKARCLITTRPRQGIESTTDSTIVEVPPLTKTEAFNLVAAADEQTSDIVYLARLSDSIREAIRRPLFALLLGTHLRSSAWGDTATVGELIASIVKQILSKAAVDASNAFDILVRLAALSNRKFGSAVKETELGTNKTVQALLDSRLIVVHNGFVSLGLAIFREWFGAQSLLAGEVSLEELSENAILLEAWSSTLVMAIANFDNDRVTRILRPIVERHPAIAANIVSEAIAKWGVPNDPLIPPALECGARIRTAMKSWTTGLGELSRYTAPVRPDGSILPIGVARDGKFLSVSWYYGPDQIGDVVNLPSGSERKQNHMSDWPGIRMAQPAQQPAWAWLWTLEDLRGEVKKRVESENLPSATWKMIQESVWPWLTSISRRGLTREQRINVEFPEQVTIAELEVFLAEKHTGRFVSVPYSGAQQIDLLAVTELVKLAMENGMSILPSPWPLSDRDPDARGWIGTNYSDERLLQRTASVFADALEAYTLLVNDWFGNLAERMQLYALLPCRIKGVIQPAVSDTRVAPMIGWYTEPLAKSESTKVDFEIGDFDAVHSVLSGTFDRMREQIRIHRSADYSWLVPIIQTEPLKIFHQRPISSLAYAWLQNDLRKINWA